MRPNALLIWFLTGTIAAIAIAWLAAQIHASGHAPIGLTSLGVGLLLGAALAGIAASQRLAGLRCLIIGTIVLAILAIAAEHAWLYRDFRGQWQEARTKSAAAAMIGPETPPSPREYFAHEWNPALWLTDAVIIVVAATGAAFYARRFWTGTTDTPITSDTPKSLTPDL